MIEVYFEDDLDDSKWDYLEGILNHIVVGFRYLGHLYGLGTPGVPASSSPTAEEAAKIEEAWDLRGHNLKISRFPSEAETRTYHCTSFLFENVAKRYINHVRMLCEDTVLRFVFFFSNESKRLSCNPNFFYRIQRNQLKGQKIWSMENLDPDRKGNTNTGEKFNTGLYWEQSNTTPVGVGAWPGRWPQLTN